MVMQSLQLSIRKKIKANNNIKESEDQDDDPLEPLAVLPIVQNQNQNKHLSLQHLC